MKAQNTSWVHHMLSMHSRFSENIHWLCPSLMLLGLAVQVAVPAVNVGVTVASPPLLLTVKSRSLLVALPGVMHTLVLAGAVTSTVGLVLMVTSVTTVPTLTQATSSCWAVAFSLMVKPGLIGLLQLTVTTSPDVTAVCIMLVSGSGQEGTHSSQALLWHGPCVGW